VNAGRIADAKPNLQLSITKRLLSIDDTKHTEGHKELMKSYAIDSMAQYFDQSKDKTAIIEFVKSQVTSKSPRTRKSAKAFIIKFKIQ
jgi:hypothetical protein